MFHHLGKNPHSHCKKCQWEIKIPLFATNASRSERRPEKVVMLIKARLQAVIFGRADGLF